MNRRDILKYPKLIENEETGRNNFKNNRVKELKNITLFEKNNSNIRDIYFIISF